MRSDGPARLEGGSLPGSSLPDLVPPVGNTGGSPFSPVFFDWLRVSFPDMEDSRPFRIMQGIVAGWFRGCGHWLSSVELGEGGWLGFKDWYSYRADGVELARAGHGGDAMRGRGCAQLLPAGCRLVEDWEAVRLAVEGLGGRITRVDLAVDCFGTLTVDEALQEYREGTGWQDKGRRKPSARLIDDLGNATGRTLYIGRRDSSRMCRVYEKGLQLGERPDWVRFEVELKRVDHDVPLDVLSDPAGYFVGCYPFLYRVANAGARRTPRIVREVTTELDKAVENARRSAGGVVEFLARRMGWGPSRIVAWLRPDGASVVRDLSIPPQFRSLVAPVDPVGRLVDEEDLMRGVA